MESHFGFDLYFPSDVKHIFLCLLATYISSVEKYLFRLLDYCESFFFLSLLTIEL
jgi:hypothetical protein